MNPPKRKLWNLKGMAFYPCSINNNQASIWVDTSVVHEIPLEEYPFFQAVRVYLRYPNPVGLSTDTETKELFEIEDFLVPLWEESLNGIFVGRVTTNGYREFYFYAEREELDNTLRDAVIERFECYDFSGQDGSLDPNWDTYFDCIYPNDLGYQYVVLQRTIQDLSDQSSTQKPSAISFFFYFDDEQSCDAAQRELMSLPDFVIVKDAAALLGHFRLTVVCERAPELSEVYRTFEVLSAAGDVARSGYSHCEVERDGFHYDHVSSDVRLRVAADVESGLRPRTDLSRFKIRFGEPIDLP